MSEHKMNLRDLKIDKSWSIFLDRDGVINVKRDNDYVKTVEEFIFLEGAQKAIQYLNSVFGRMLLVTNQQGVGKGIMSHDDLKLVHDFMEAELEKSNSIFDQLYYCPDLAAENSSSRKPNIGMALKAKQDFPEINFERSILVGDSITDIEMGKRAGMKTVFIHSALENPENADLVVKSLADFSVLLENC